MSDAGVEQAVSRLRHALDAEHPNLYIETVSRRGYCFVAPVAPRRTPTTETDLDAMMAPYLALIDGRALIESFSRARIDDAISLFEQLVARHPTSARCHAGLANAYAWRFEALRTDDARDRVALDKALVAANEARRIDRHYGAGWAAYGFAIERTGDRLRAVAALEHACALEPNCWPHALRLGSASWGEGRLRAAQRTLELRPHLPVAHLLSATVFLARGSSSLVERELAAGLAAFDAAVASGTTFACIALNWLMGLVCHSRGEFVQAIEWLEREIALAATEHVYARELSANAWYASGVCYLELGNEARARQAFGEAMQLVPRHPMVRARLAILDSRTVTLPPGVVLPFEARMAVAAMSVASGDVSSAVRMIDDGLAAAPAGNTGWTIPIEPSLAVHRAPDVWAPVLERLRNRAG